MNDLSNLSPSVRSQVESFAKKLAPQMLSRLGEPVDVATDQLAEEHGLDVDRVKVQIWDAVFAEIYLRLSVVD